jgi:hypothetical protein
MNWLKKIFKKAIFQSDETNSNSGKSFEDMYADIGVFKYDNEGFTINCEDIHERINWKDINQLNVFKVDLVTVDRIDMQIVYGDKGITISEELPGWFQFILKTKDVFPSIPKDWDITIIHPAFADNYRTIYEKTDGTI